jgi:protocatechuate 3,4-dioxygenase beta subunit
MSAQQRVPLWFSALLVLLGLGGVGLLAAYFWLGGGELPLARVPSGAPAARGVEAPVPPTPLSAVGTRSQPNDVHEARRIEGVVRLPDGRPAAGAVVTVLRAETAWPEWRSARLDQAVTGGDGVFAFRLPIEHGVLLAYEHANYAGGLVEAPIPLDRYELRLQPGFTLRGMVTNERGAPIAGATIVVESALADQRRAVTALSTATGAYTFANLAAGPVRVTARHPWWQPAAAPVVVIGAAPRVDLRFDRPALPPVAGRVVVAATQEPVADATVEFLPAGGRPGLQAATVVRTEADGTFRIDGLGRGNHRALVRHAEFGAVSRSLAVGPALGELLLELPPRSLVGGRLVAASGDGGPPTEGLVLELRDAVGETAVTTVAKGGTFAFVRPLSPGVASLRILRGTAAFARNRSAELAVRIEEDDATELELSILAPSLVRGRVVDERGRPVGGAWIEQTRVVGENARSVGDAAANLQLFRAGSALADLVTFDRDTLLDVSAADGTFAVRGLPPGFAVLRFQSPGLGGRWLRVTPNPSAGPTDLGDVVLVAGVALRGRVVRGGAPVAGAPVAVFGREMQALAVTRGDGSFVVEDLPPGSYRLRARLPSTAGTTTELAVELAPGGDGAPIEMVMPQGRTLRGVVQGSDGQPVPGALVAVRGSAGPVATDSVGEFAIELPERAVELQVSLGDRLRETRVAVSAAQTRVVVALDTPPTCTLVGSVFGLPGRKRLPGVVVRAIDLDGGTADRAVWVDLQNGEFRWPLCPVGRLRIELHAEGHAPAAFERQLAASEIHGLGEVLLEPGAQLRGRVLDVGGEPIVDAAVYLGEETDLDLFDPRTRTDVDGAFTVQGVSTRSDRLVVRARGYAIRSVELDLPTAVLSPDPLEVRLARGATIEVVVSRPGERDVGVVQLVRDGRVVAGAALDELGRAVFANRSEGRYEVRLLGAEFAARTVQVGSAGGVVRVLF